MREKPDILISWKLSAVRSMMLMCDYVPADFATTSISDFFFFLLKE